MRFHYIAWYRLLPAFLLLLALPGVAFSSPSGKAQLNSFFTQVKSMQAQFEQVVASKSLSGLEKSTGVLYMQRPGMFRWDYKEPYPQHIVADGKKLWIHDVEMEQVIIKPVDIVLGNTPAVLLSGNSGITDKFIVKEEEERSQIDGRQWVELTPKQEEAGFDRIYIVFKDGQLHLMELHDAFGQITRLSFSKLQINPGFPNKLFQFEVPQGVDVIDETAAR